MALSVAKRDSDKKTILSDISYFHWAKSFVFVSDKTKIKQSKKLAEIKTFGGDTFFYSPCIMENQF